MKILVTGANGYIGQGVVKDNGYDITLEYDAFPDRPYDSKAIWGNNSKIMKILGA